ncbi:MAG: HrpE/YscL family type III secretion apparatus protein [Puniceicoccales bacterium]|jgi:type III secretion protein L|nr:HrpE/YscL family type III secretion apparatus protein [Puniceicoccales bacterium]
MWMLKKDEKKLQIVPGKRILHADEFMSFGSVGEIINETETLIRESLSAAETKAKQIVSDAQAEAKKIIGGAKAAFETERKKGHAAGMAEGKQELSELMMSVTAKRMESFERFEESIVNIVMRSVKRIIGEMDNAQRLKAIVHNALSAVRNQKRVVVRVNPEQATAVRESIGGIAKGGDGDAPFVEVIADGRLHANDCIIETEIGTVDASLDIQLKAIEKSLQKHVVQD